MAVAPIVSAHQKPQHNIQVFCALGTVIEYKFTQALYGYGIKNIIATHKLYFL